MSSPTRLWQRNTHPLYDCKVVHWPLRVPCIGTIPFLKLVYTLDDWGEAFGTMVERPKSISLAFPSEVKAVIKIYKQYISILYIINIKIHIKFHSIPITTHQYYPASNLDATPSHWVWPSHDNTP